MHIRLPLLAFAVIAVAGAPRVFAHPTVAPNSCSVTIIRAPDAVRAEIARWVAGEHHCETTLELRAVATAEGFYLFARDGFGREHERFVPDAQTAGVLVASWIADDSSRLLIPIAPITPIAPVAERPELRPPGIVEGAPEHADVAADRGRGGHAFTFGAVAAAKLVGAKAEIDLFVSGPWSVGVGLAMVSPYSTPPEYRYRLNDVSAMASAARRVLLGSLELRLQVGAGLALTRSADPDFQTEGPFPVIEYSVLVSHGYKRWAFTWGPTLTQYMRLGDGNVYYEAMALEGRQTVLSLFGGLRRRL